MSIKLMNRIWDAPLGSPTDKLVLLTLADYANDHGSNIYPSVATLARRCDLTARAVQISLKRMTDKGWIAAAGKWKVKHGFVTRYRIHASALPKTGELGSPVEETGERGSPEGVNHVRGTGEPRSPNPSFNHQIEPPKGADAPRVFPVSDGPNTSIANSAAFPKVWHGKMPKRQPKLSPANLTESNDLRIAAYLKYLRDEITPTNAERICGKVGIDHAAVWDETCREWAECEYNPTNFGGLFDKFESKVRARRLRGDKTTRPATTADRQAAPTMRPPIRFEEQPDGSMLPIYADEVTA